jgi:hypothetical protein
MTYKAKHPAAFINVIHEEGTKEDAVLWLQKIWDEYMELNIRITKLEELVRSLDTENT